MSQRTTLRDGLPDTASWVYFEDDGTLVIEFFDHSLNSEQSFGNDVALMIRVAPGEHHRVVASLLDARDPERGTRESAILRALSVRFASYFQVKAWLDEFGIAYDKRFDPWA